jgi:hypothetical protein
MSAVIAQTRTAFAGLSRHERSSWPTRRALQLALGLMWLLDTALQFQPYMFSRGIATGQATDPNSGPLLILLAACFWPPASSCATEQRQPTHSPSSRAALP